ncbi:MAG: acetyl-CoA carboxylase biotin carboxyl carrier protein, partial [Oscillospiraceae bacterium]|nr:acetyl-CoA carboxylase biotin carboxyl carrier protein [Oscillospiraceae bacterium]
DITIEGKRNPPPPPVGVIPPVGAIPAAVAPVAGADIPAEKKADVPEKGNFITSPIIGTFYTSPSPEKPCFVKVGDTVNAGDVVCIIESMKLMNEITSEFSGRVAEVYVNNADSVEFGQKLFRIE